jgi:hypothetical protein
MVAKINLLSGEGGPKIVNKPLTEGVQEARVVRIIQLGVQPANPRFTDSKPTPQMMIMFEMADDEVDIKGELKPAMAFMRVNIVGGEKSKLTKLALAAKLDPENLEFKDFLGKALSLTIKNKKSGDNVYSNIADFSGLSDRAASTVPEVVTDSYFLDFDDPDPKVLGELGNGMLKLIQNAINYSGSVIEKVLKQLDDSKQTTEITAKDLDNDVI